MTFVVKEQCIKCKYTDCVEVCPVDCFYEGENMLVINPEECIDCGACEIECQVGAIKSDDDPDAGRFLEVNEKYARLWPRITRKKNGLPDADQWRATENKFEQYFNPSAGEQSENHPDELQ